MEYTFQFSSNATNVSARYVDILQQTIELIINDSMITVVLIHLQIKMIAMRTCLMTKIHGMII